MITTKEIHIILQAARERIWRGMQQLEQEMAVHMSLDLTLEEGLAYYKPAPDATWASRRTRMEELRNQITSHAELLMFLSDTLEHKGDTKERAKLFAQYLGGDRSFLQPRK